MRQSEFEDIAERIRLKAVKIASSMSVGDDEAEDIAQEVMLKLWTVRDDISSISHAENLAVCIARHRAIDGFRRQHTVPINSNKSYIDEKQPTPDVSLEEHENMEWLKNKLAQLPSTEYKILRLRQIERKTYDEIATMLGISPASVSTLLSRARNKILGEIMKRRK